MRGCRKGSKRKEGKAPAIQGACVLVGSTLIRPCHWMHNIVIHIGFYSILIASSYYIDLMRSGDVVASAIDHKVSPKLMWLQLKEMITVLVSYGGCSKMPHTWHLKMAEINSFIVLVAGNPRPHKAVLCWGHKGEITTHLFTATGFWNSLTCGISSTISASKVKLTTVFRSPLVSLS